MRRAARRDATESEIVNALERCGVKVWKVNGTFDLVCQFRGVQKTLECKSKRGSLTKAQEEMGAHGFEFHVVYSPEAALDAMDVPLRMRL